MKEVGKYFSLERLANGSIVLTALVAFGLLGFNYFVRNARPNVGNGLVRGDSFPQLSTKSYGDYDRTLLIVLTTGCDHCQAGLPFYRRLIDTGRQAGEPVHIVAVFTNDASEVSSYLTSNQLAVDTVTNISLGELKIAGTPSLILLNQQGKVSDFWIGRLSADQETQVLKSTFRL